MSNYQILVAELFGTFDDLRDKKEELKTEIYEEEEERRRIEKELEILSERLDRVNGNYILKLIKHRNYNENIYREARTRKDHLRN